MHSPAARAWQARRPQAGPLARAALMVDSRIGGDGDLFVGLTPDDRLVAMRPAVPSLLGGDGTVASPELFAPARFDVTRWTAVTLVVDVGVAKTPGQRGALVASAGMPTTLWVTDRCLVVERCALTDSLVALVG